MAYAAEKKKKQRKLVSNRVEGEDGPRLPSEMSHMYLHLHTRIFVHVPLTSPPHIHSLIDFKVQ